MYASRHVLMRTSEPPHYASVYDVIHGSLLHLPFPGFAIVAGEGEAVPILVVELRMVRPVVISGPPRLLPEKRVLRNAFRGENAVMKLPRTLQLVQVLSAEMFQVFIEHAEQL